MSKWLQSSSSRTSVRQLVTPTPGTMGQPPERHQGQDRATSIFSFTRSQMTLALLLLFGLRPHTADRDARAEIRDTGSIPGLAADLPREPGQASLLLLPRLFLAKQFNPWHFSAKTLYRKELRIAIPILQTRKLADCHFPKAVLLARSLEIKSRDLQLRCTRICTHRPD